MPIEDVLRAVRRNPFVPFRVYITDGSSYDVLHPELLMAGKRSVVIGLTSPNHPEAVYDRFVDVDLLHITRLEPLPVAVKPNGHQ